MRAIDVERFLEDVTGRYAKPYTEAMQAMVIHQTRGEKGKYRAALKRLEESMTQSMGVSEILGASLGLQTAAKVIADEPEMERFAAARDMSRFALGNFAITPAQALLPRVTFTEAVEDMIQRAPATIKNAAERTARNIAKLYSEGRVTAFVKSAEHAVTERVQGLISEALRTGSIVGEGGGILVGEGAIGRGIKMSVESIRKETQAWTESYSRMVFRTNMNTAVTAGRWKQGLDPDISSVMPAVQNMTAGDVDVRKPDHSAGNGVIMLRTNPLWRIYAPPIDYNCRCTPRDVGVPELRRMDRIRIEPTVGFTRVNDGLWVREDRPPAGWKPNPNFRQGGRIDLGI